MSAEPAGDIAAHEKIPEQALAWFEAGRGAALASVIATWGSAPRQAGAQLAVSGEAELSGSVSGGCVEAAVAAEALEAIADGRPRVLEFGVSDDDAFAVGLACGGTVRVLVDPIIAEPRTGGGMPAADLHRVAAARAARTPLGYLVGLKAFERRFVAPADAPEAFAADRSGLTETLGGGFLALHNPPLRLLIVGAAHIAQALAPMATLAGYDVHVADPRQAFAAPERFAALPLEHVVAEWPDALIDRLGLDGRTAVVCLTHDPKIDDGALAEALRSQAFYVGALGSTRTHAKRVERLGAAGLRAQDIDKLDAPIGLDIGAKTPAEIAVAILGAMTLRLRRAEISG